MTTDQDKQQAIEAFFLARGWAQKPLKEVAKTWHGEKALCWIDESGNPFIGKRESYNTGGMTEPYAKELPDIIDHYPSFKEHVLEVMEGEGFKFSIDSKWWACWTFFDPKISTADPDIFIERYDCKGKPIKDNEITLAAVLAATEYWEGKNAGVNP